jgi:hypothetical protein
MGVRVYVYFKGQEVPDEAGLEIVRVLANNDNLTLEDLKGYKKLLAEYENTWSNPNQEIGYGVWKKMKNYPYSQWYGCVYDALGFERHPKTLKWLSKIINQDEDYGLCEDKVLCALAFREIVEEIGSQASNLSVAAARICAVIDGLSWS